MFKIYVSVYNTDPTLELISVRIIHRERQYLNLCGRFLPKTSKRMGYTIGLVHCKRYIININNVFGIIYIIQNSTIIIINYISIIHQL